MVRWVFGRQNVERSEASVLRRSVAFFGLLIGVGLAAQLLGSGWYLGRMLPGTKVGDINIGGLSLPQAQNKLSAVETNYRVALSINAKQYDFTPAQLGVSYNTTSTVRAAYNTRRVGWWKTGATTPVNFAYHVSSSTLASAVTAVANDIGTQPVDASLVVVKGQLNPVSDQDGFTLDKVALAGQIQAHLASASMSTLIAAPHRQSADIVVADLATTENSAKQLMATSVTLTYGTHTWTPSAAEIGSWLTFVRTDDGLTAHLVPQVDTAKLRTYVQTLASQVDVAPVTMLTTVENGTATINRAGTDGTAIDQSATAAAISSAITSSQPLNYAITDSIVPFKTSVTNFTLLDLPSYIEVNLSKQHLWVWQDGAIIYDSPVTSGASAAGYATAEGLFHIYYKTTNTILNGQQYGPRYDYADFVKYWMPFYQGFGLHDASWRNGNFGETSGPFGYLHDGSHGCVNLPDATAAWIYNWSVVGTPVWVHE